MSFLLPVCLPVLPPSTTSLSSWKNWLTTVCLFNICNSLFPLSRSS
uniref:Uncharacterized protein n=1 Tax=Phakopsora pachyrhizi TaxID=170000 RepID=A0A0S1MJX7_PHAPC